MPDPRDLLPPLPGEPSKLAYTEGLLDVLSDIFDLSTTDVTHRLLKKDIGSWSDFKSSVRESAKTAF